MSAARTRPDISLRQVFGYSSLGRVRGKQRTTRGNQRIERGPRVPLGAAIETPKSSHGSFGGFVGRHRLEGRVLITAHDDDFPRLGRFLQFDLMPESRILFEKLPNEFEVFTGGHNQRCFLLRFGNERRNVRLAECPSMGAPITVFAPQSSGSEDYRALALEIIDQEMETSNDQVINV